MKIDPVNWRREMKNFVGAELTALKKEISQLRADLAGTSTASTGTVAVAAPTTDSNELAELKKEIAQLRKDLDSLTELLRILAANQMLANVEREISPQTDSAAPATKIATTPNAEILDEVQSVKDDVSNLREDLLSAIRNLSTATKKKTTIDDYSNDYGNEKYYSATTTIQNRTGIHARPASVFVQTASRFRSKVQIKAKGKTVDAESILMLMSMGLTRGTKVTITADGPDAREAVKTLVRLIDDKFGED